MENWKSVLGYEEIYEISKIGEVKSLERYVKLSRGGMKIVRERILKPYLNKKGYLIVNLSKNQKQKTRSVHQLLAEAFFGHIPCGMELVVDHKNHIKTDNRVENLRVVPQRVNANHKHIKSSSQYTGVSWNKVSKRWYAKICINRKKTNLGSFTNEIEAHHAYQDAYKNIPI